MIAELWLAKADRCLKTARLALADSDPDSACNRAYYAMFNAARAALLDVGEGELAMAKTHSGLVTAFGLYVAKPGHVLPELGRSLAKEANRRLVSDYDGDPLSVEDATAALVNASAFVAAIKALADQKNLVQE